MPSSFSISLLVVLTFFQVYSFFRTYCLLIANTDMYSFFYIYFIKNFIQFHGYFKASNFTEVVVSSRDAQDTAIKTESTDSEH